MIRFDACQVDEAVAAWACASSSDSKALLVQFSVAGVSGRQWAQCFSLQLGIDRGCSERVTNAEKTQ